LLRSWLSLASLMLVARSNSGWGMFRAWTCLSTARETCTGNDKRVASVPAGTRHRGIWICACNRWGRCIYTCLERLVQSWGSWSVDRIYGRTYVQMEQSSTVQVVQNKRLGCALGCSLCRMVVRQQGRTPVNPASATLSVPILQLDN